MNTFRKQKISKNYEPKVVLISIKYHVFGLHDHFTRWKNNSYTVKLGYNEQLGTG